MHRRRERRQSAIFYLTCAIAMYHEFARKVYAMCTPEWRGALYALRPLAASCE